jgi:hypothetical protein
MLSICGCLQKQHSYVRSISVWMAGRGSRFVDELKKNRVALVEEWLKEWKEKAYEIFIAFPRKYYSYGSE